MSGLGMRAIDVRGFMQVADLYQVIILVRQTNEASLPYIGRKGFYPKPIIIKAKTADVDPPVTTIFDRGVKRREYHIAGLVIHPGFHPTAYRGDKFAKAKDCWEQTIKKLAPEMCNRPVSPDKPDSLIPWGVVRRGAHKAWHWKWRVDIDQSSSTFGCIQLKTKGMSWSCIHGDYDLKDVIVLGQERDNRSSYRKIDGVKNSIPLLKGMEFETIRKALNEKVGCEMVQHGAEAQFAWHGDEGVTVIYPDWRHKVLLSASTVQGWYQDLGRRVLAKTGKDYLHDRTRMFHYGPDGLHAPGEIPPGVSVSDLH